jgi:hypothetical protein
LLEGKTSERKCLVESLVVGWHPKKPTWERREIFQEAQYPTTNTPQRWYFGKSKQLPTFTRGIRGSPMKVPTHPNACRLCFQYNAQVSWVIILRKEKMCERESGVKKTVVDGWQNCQFETDVDFALRNNSSQ